VDFDSGSTGDAALILGLKAPVPLGDAWLDLKIRDSAELKKTMKALNVGAQVPPLSFLQASQNQERLITDDPEKIENALKLLKRTFAVSIVDCGSRLDGATQKVLDMASLILVISNPEILVLNQTRRILGDSQ
jgi:septum site-determining protein MinD